MNKLKFFLLSFLIGNSCFAEDIFLVSTANSCVLNRTNVNNSSYVKLLNQKQKWTSYQGSNLISTTIELGQFFLNTDVCTDTIFMNEIDKEKFTKNDLLTNKMTKSNPYPIVEIKDNKILNIIKKNILEWITQHANLKLNLVKSFKVLNGFQYQSKYFQLIEIRSFTDFNKPPKKGDFSYVVLYNSINNEIIPLETWELNKVSEDILKIENMVEGFLDIDNDNEYELVIRSSYYEGSSSTLFKIINGKAISKRNCSCGV